jgi:SH3-like domain-containing protein
MNGQGQANTHMRRASALMKLTAALIFTSQTALAAPADRPTPSGLPVPRYVSLKFDQVNARSGPGDDHKLLWVYRVRGLPVQVVAENSEWRRVCDPEHGMAWVHKRTTDGRRMVIRMQAAPLPLHRSPKAESHVIAMLNPRAMATLVRCDSQGWCKLRVDGANGWAPASEVWGTDEKPQCG